MEFKNKNYLYDKINILHDIWDYLCEDYSIEQMVLASKMGKPALWAVFRGIKQLLDKGEEEIVEYEKNYKDIRKQINQLIGVMIKEVMETKNFTVFKSYILSDSYRPFKSASIYTEKINVDNKYDIGNLKNDINNIFDRCYKTNTEIQTFESIFRIFNYEYRDMDRDDSDRKKIKKLFLDTIIDILYEIEIQIKNNIEHQSNMKNDIIFASIGILISSFIEINNKNVDLSVPKDNMSSSLFNSISNIINSNISIDNLKNISKYIISEMQKSKILTDDEISDYILPIVNRIGV